MEIKRKNIAIFLSGAGSNALNILSYFKNSELVNCVVVVTNNLAWTIDKSTYPGVDILYLNTKKDLNETLIPALQKYPIDFIVLAGFLWKIPETFVQHYPHKIINLHPSLLPKYGGKGMYGLHVHKAVIDNKEKESGITIHYVNEHYDEGAIVFQEKVKIEPQETPQSLQNKIRQLEHQFLPATIERILRG